MAAATTETTSSKKRQKDKSDKSPVKVIKTPVDLQRLKLEKLMKNPEKEVVIPDKSKEKVPRPPLEFIRNIWGSSAGAGSGDFHVYRGVRRREYARQKFIKEKADKDELDTEYKKRLEQHKQEAEDRTAKNRAKRLKKKQKLKAKKKLKKSKNDTGKQSSESECSDEEEDETSEIPSSDCATESGEDKGGLALPAGGLDAAVVTPLAPVLESSETMSEAGGE